MVPSSEPRSRNDLAHFLLTSYRGAPTSARFWLTCEQGVGSRCKSRDRLLATHTQGTRPCQFKYLHRCCTSYPHTLSVHVVQAEPVELMVNGGGGEWERRRSRGEAQVRE